MSSIFISIFSRIFLISMALQFISQAKLYDIGRDPISHAKIPLPPADPNGTFEFLTWINSDYYKGLYIWLSTYEATFDDARYNCVLLGEHFEGVKYYDELEYEATIYPPDNMKFIYSNWTRDALSALLSNLTPKVTMWVDNLSTERHGLDKTKQCTVMVWKVGEETHRKEDADCDEKHLISCSGRPVCYQPDFPHFHEREEPGNCTLTENRDIMW